MDGSINFSGTLVGSIADSGGGKIQDVQTNASGDYESVVDEQGIAKIDLYNYTTNEQLESAIDNINDVLLTKLNKVNLSTEEQNTGIKWINGKDIFLKVYDLIVPNINGLYSFPDTETPNLEEVVFSYYSLNNRGMSSYTPWFNDATLLLDDITSNSINMYFQSTYHSGKPLKFILAYTKTGV